MVISTLKNLWKPVRSIVYSHITEARTTGQLQRGSSSTLLSQFSGGQVSVVDSGRQDQWRSGYVGRSFDPVISYTLNPFPSSIWVQFINYSGINRNDAPPRIYLNVATNRVHCVFEGLDSRGSRFLQPPEIDQLLLCSEKFWPGKHSIWSQPHEKTINFINFVNVHHSPGGPNVKEYWYQPRKKTV